MNTMDKQFETHFCEISRQMEHLLNQHLKGRLIGANVWAVCFALAEHCLHLGYTEEHLKWYFDTGLRDAIKDYKKYRSE